MAKIPKALQRIFWSVKISQLDIEKNKVYIIHQVLQYGTLSDIRWLFITYGKKEIIQSFIKHPSKNYPKAVYYFIKNYILGLKNLVLDEDNYTTSISGRVRQRTAKSI